MAPRPGARESAALRADRAGARRRSQPQVSSADPTDGAGESGLGLLSNIVPTGGTRRIRIVSPNGVMRSLNRKVQVSSPAEVIARSGHSERYPCELDVIVEPHTLPGWGSPARAPPVSLAHETMNWLYRVANPEGEM